jgi:HD-GYP domain-containing protein (c-di-GMP phosphodiesterase class II)
VWEERSWCMSQLETYEAAMAVCDPTLGGHAERVTRHAEAIVRRLGWPDAKIQELRLGAALHDVGKINVRPGLLDKRGRLEPGELEAIRAHPVEGAWLIAGVRSLEVALPYVLFHHERWDGNGYPTHRAALDIPIEGRVLAVVDAFDAMTSDRPYRRALQFEEALGEMERCSGAQFDPELVDVFVDLIRDADEVAA